MPLTDLAWLRLLLEDEPTKEIEAVTGNGTDREFTVSNPPISVGRWPSP